MKPKILPVKLTFTEPLLGTASGNPDIQAEFIASKAPTQENSKEEVEAISVADAVEKASTIFPRDAATKAPFLWDYQIRGAIKESLGVLIELGEIDLSKWLRKKIVDSVVFVNPRRIFLFDENGNQILDVKETLQRPLRGDTPRGERIALARSEMLPVGTTCNFRIELLESTNPKSPFKLKMEEIIMALNYGALKGLGQWRSGGWGRYRWEEGVIKS